VKPAAAGFSGQRFQWYDMITLAYSLVIEATDEPDYFGYFSPELEGFTGIGHSIEDCLYQARRGMEEHVALLKERGLPAPSRGPNPQIIIQNEARLIPA
jgi:predicted RNase H-like HicB family nuclease